MMNFTKQPMVANIYCRCGEHDVIDRLSGDAWDALKMEWMDDMYEGYTKDQYCDTEMTNDDFEEGLSGRYAVIVEMYGATCDPACDEVEANIFHLQSGKIEEIEKVTGLTYDWKSYRDYGIHVFFEQARREILIESRDEITNILLSPCGYSETISMDKDELKKIIEILDR